MKRKALSLVELVVVLGITLFLLVAIYYAYVHLLKKYISGSGRTAVSMSTIVGEEVINQDIEHAGYGISVKEPKSPIKFWRNSKGERVLTIRSTYVVTNRSTKGWAIVNCSSGSPVPVSYSQWPLPSNYAVFMDFAERVIEPYEEIGNFTCSSSDYVLVFPVQKINLRSGERYICDDQACAQIDYYLYSSSKVNPDCRDMKVLGRKVSWKVKSNGKLAGSVQPFLDCVADFQVRIDWGNRKYVDPYDTSDPDYAAIQNATFDELRNNLKMVHIYLLVREGGKDPNYVFNGSTKIEPDNVELQLPSNYQHYHWKVIKLSIEPVNIIRK